MLQQILQQLHGLGIVVAVGQALIAICPQNVPLLLVFRFMVGIGAAGIAPVVMSYIMMEFPPEKMGQGFTIYMALACGMVIFGPTLGGIVMKVIGTASAWRIVMWICVALCVISFLICFAKVKDNPNIPKGSMKGFDWAGAVFVLLMFGALVCVPTFGQQNGGHAEVLNAHGNRSATQIHRLPARSSTASSSPARTLCSPC
mgnify:CR=1 FL=1